MRPVELKDFLEYKFLSELSVSPTGDNAAFVVTVPNLQLSGYDQKIWFMDLKTGKYTEATHLGKEKNYTWDSDDTILFPTVKTDEQKAKIEKGYELTPYWRLKVGEGVPTEAFTLPISAGKAQNLGNGLYLISGLCDLRYPDLTGKSQAEADAILKDYFDTKADVDEFDELPFWFTMQGKVNKKRSALWIYNENTGDLKKITPDYLHTEGFEVSPCKQYIAYFGYEYDSVRGEDHKLYIYRVEEGVSFEPTEEKQMRFRFAGFMNGKLALAGSVGDSEEDFKNPRFYQLDPGTGKIELWADHDCIVKYTVTTDCRYGSGCMMKVHNNELYFVTTLNNGSFLAKLNAAGEMQVLTHDLGSVDFFDIFGSKAYICGLRDMKLQEVYEVDLTTGQEKQLTFLNEDFIKTHYVAQPRPLSFMNDAGIRIDGWVLLPPDFDENKKYKGMLQIHGGPKNTYAPVYAHELQMFASEGYIVFYSNPRGSEGRGIGFANLNDGLMGTLDYRDLMQFTDAVLKAYPQIDEKNVVVAGGSYGGYMTNWIIGHTDRFRAACSQRSVTNWVSISLTSDNGWLSREHGGHTWDHVEKLWNVSPLAYANKCVTPTLFIHSDEDYRCYHAEGLQMFQAVKANGADAKMLFFHGESHELCRSGKPRNRIRRLEGIRNWFIDHTDKF